MTRLIVQVVFPGNKFFNCLKTSHYGPCLYQGNAVPNKGACTASRELSMRDMVQ